MYMPWIRGIMRMQREKKADSKERKKFAYKDEKEEKGRFDFMSINEYNNLQSRSYFKRSHRVNRTHSPVQR